VSGSPGYSPGGDHETRHLSFEDTSLLPPLFGEHDRHLALIENRLGVLLVPRGNQVAVSGGADAVAIAENVLRQMYGQLQKGRDLDQGAIEGVIRLASSAGGEETSGEEIVIRTRRKPVIPRSATQKAYLQALQDHDLTFGLGPAGTGKTYLAVAMAVSHLIAGRVDRIILSRPAVEAGENLGFLPGDMREKVDPYLRPLYDALYDMLPGEQVARQLESGEIEIAPLAFMRGRTLANAYVILDEAQNTTPAQMKMFMTRLGENARMVITGDLSQVDLPEGITSGLAEAAGILQGVRGVAFVHFTARDVVRHPLVSRIVDAYEAHEKHEREQARGRKKTGRKGDSGKGK